MLLPKLIVGVFCRAGIFVVCVACAARGGEWWVAPNGNDANAGTSVAPLATPAAALLRAREDKRRASLSAGGSSATGEPVTRIVLRGGVYYLSEALAVRPEDGGTGEKPTVIEAAPGEHPVLSGGVPISGWHLASDSAPGLPAAAQGHVWEAPAPRAGAGPLEFRELWVNGRKAVRARTPAGGKMDRLTAWDERGRSASFKAPPVAGSGSGDRWHDLKRMEMVVHQQWEIAVLRLNSWRRNGSDALVTFQAPESELQFRHPYPAPVMAPVGNAPFYLVNAIEFLDTPGEWYEDVDRGRIYYFPQPGETPDRIQVVAPRLDTVVTVDGTLEQLAAHVTFRGVAFEHCGWLRPSQQGLVPLQAGMYLLESYRLDPPGIPGKPSLDNLDWIGRPPGAVTVRGAKHVRFEGCRFEHLGSAGLDFEWGTSADTVVGCLFRDIGGNGLQVGMFSDPGHETHLPYAPKDEREISTGDRIADNLITDCGTEDWGCVGIAAGYVRSIVIEHNEVRNQPYSGISLGWGWTPLANAMKNNRVVANYVHHVAQIMSDEGGIYLLSAQPGTVVAENRIEEIRMSPYAEDPAHWFYLYLDEGSSAITVRDNWCPAERYLKNANGPGNGWERNGPGVAAEIRERAGVEAKYRELLAW